MPAKTLTAEAAQAANIQLVGSDKGHQAVHDLIVAYQANRRSGTACAKTRGEVSGNNKKIFRQKGTGNARHGDKRAPIFVGGGVVFGPRPRDYSKKVQRNTRRLALRRVLGELISAGTIQTVDSFAIADGKTKSFIAAVTALTGAVKVLIIAKDFTDETFLAARNISWALLMSAHEVNIEQLLSADAVILVEDALEILAARTA
jgi:large subunit ribosomal protein L4